MNHTAKNSFIIAIACIPFIHVRTDTITVKDILPEAFILTSLAATVYTSKIPVALLGLMGIGLGSAHIKLNPARARWQQKLASRILFISNLALGVLGSVYLAYLIIPTYDPLSTAPALYVKSLLKSINKGIFYKPQQ